MHKLTDTVSWYAPIYALYEQRRDSHSDISEHMPRLKVFVEQLKPRHVFELGVCTGNSTLSFLAGLGKADWHWRLYSLDIVPIIGEVGNWVEKIPEWHFYQTNDLPYYFLLPGEARIIFVDTEHNYPQTIQEIQQYAPHLQQNGVMLFHDTDERTGFTVKKAMLEWSAKYDWRCYFWPNNNGLGVMYRASNSAKIEQVIKNVNMLVPLR